MYKRCITMRSCSQTRPKICFQTLQGILICSLSGLSLPDSGQFLVLLNQSEQDREPLSALALDCLCQTGLPAWSVSFPFHRTILLFLLLCKIKFPGSVKALRMGDPGNFSFSDMGGGGTWVYSISDFVRQGGVGLCILFSRPG